MRRRANEYMTTDEQVAFAWKYLEHFAEVRNHNHKVNIQRAQGKYTLQFRNAWQELADMPDAKADEMQTPESTGTVNHAGTARKAPRDHSPQAGPVQVDGGGFKRPPCKDPSVDWEML